MAIALCCRAMALAMLDNELILDRADRVLWLKTDKQVEVGWRLMKVHYQIVSPCTLLKDYAKAEANATQKPFTDLKKTCEKEFDEQLAPAIEAFGRCKPTRIKKRAGKVWKILVEVLAFIILDVVADKVQSLIFGSPEDEIKKLKETEANFKKNFEKVKETWKVGKFETGNMTAALKNLASDTEKIKADINRLNKIAPDIA